MTTGTQMIPSSFPTLKRSHLTLSSENYSLQGAPPNRVIGWCYYILIGTAKTKALKLLGKNLYFLSLSFEDVSLTMSFKGRRLRRQLKLCPQYLEKLKEKKVGEYL